MHDLTFICLIYSIEFFSFSVSTMKVKTMSRPFIFDELFFHFFVPKCWTKHVPSCGWKVWLYIDPFNTQLSAPDYGSFLSPWLFLPSLNRSFRWIISSRSVIMRGPDMQFIKSRTHWGPCLSLCSDSGRFHFHSIKKLEWIACWIWFEPSVSATRVRNRSWRGAHIHPFPAY